MNQNQKDQAHTAKPSSESDRNQNLLSTDYAPYPKLDPKDVAPPPENWTNVSVGSSESHPKQASAEQGSAPIFGSTATTMPSESNPYVTSAQTQPSKNKIDSVKDILGKWGKKAVETTKKAEDLAGNMWQHCPSFADAAVGRIAQGTRVLAEGGYEKIFQNTFENLPDEKLLKTYACYLSTSAGPVMGVLYLSTEKLAFCSDNPLSYQVGDKTEWSYYKVVIPINQLKAVNPSTSNVKRGEKYIQVISVDNHEFWFMSFVQYDNAVKNLREALQSSGL